MKKLLIYFFVMTLPVFAVTEPSDDKKDKTQGEILKDVEESPDAESDKTQRQKTRTNVADTLLTSGIAITITGSVFGVISEGSALNAAVRDPHFAYTPLAAKRQIWENPQIRGEITSQRPRSGDD